MSRQLTHAGLEHLVDWRDIDHHARITFSAGRVTIHSHPGLPGQGTFACMRGRALPGLAPQFYPTEWSLCYCPRQKQRCSGLRNGC